MRGLSMVVYGRPNRDGTGSAATQLADSISACGATRAPRVLEAVVDVEVVGDVVADFDAAAAHWPHRPGVPRRGGRRKAGQGR